MSNQPEQENALQKSMVFWVSRRGASNYWASVVNGMNKRFSNDEGTMSVQLTENWKYILTCHLPAFESWSPRMRLLALVHECAHVVLQHIPRLFKMLANCTDPFVRTAITSTFNFAADFAANDAIVRLEDGFTEAHKAFMHVSPDGKPIPLSKEEEEKLPGEWPFLLPEEFGLPRGKTMEEYFVLILKDLPKFKQHVEEMMKNLERILSEMGEDSEGEGEGESEDGSGGQGKSPSRRNIPPKGIPGIPDEIVKHALNSPETFEMLQKAFDKISSKAHKQWNEKAKEMTPEEAISAGNKLKKHAQTMVRAANDRVKRDRGFMPGGVQKIIDALMEPDQIPWDSILRDIIHGAISARVQEEMVSPNLSLINEDYLEPWPGQTLEFGFNITWMTDTSGSMGDSEYARACNCMNSLLAQNKFVSVTYCECDAIMQKEVKVTNIEPLTEEYLSELRTRRGYGGTVYTPFFKRVMGADEPRDWIDGAPRLEDAHPKPDLMVICTDGGVRLMGECFPKYRPECPIIWLLMPGCHATTGMDDVAPDRLIQMYKMREEE